MFNFAKFSRNGCGRAFIYTTITHKQLSKPVLNQPKSKTKDIGPLGWLLLV